MDCGMRKLKFKKQKDREWVQPIMKGYLMACCDCGLVHRLDFKIVGKKKVQFRASRARNITAKLRREQRIVLRREIAE